MQCPIGARDSVLFQRSIDAGLVTRGEPPPRFASRSSDEYMEEHAHVFAYRDKVFIIN